MKELDSEANRERQLVSMGVGVKNLFRSWQISWNEKAKNAVTSQTQHKELSRLVDYEVDRTTWIESCIHCQLCPVLSMDGVLFVFIYNNRWISNLIQYQEYIGCCYQIYNIKNRNKFGYTFEKVAKWNWQLALSKKLAVHLKGCSEFFIRYN